ncbi:MAG TPA: SRPBCC family protein [Terriglobales bacterium]|nr:SRPBCC family protein [Terriglobales bacterium]
MTRRNYFWRGFAAGAAAGAGGTVGLLLGFNYVGRAGHRRVVRLEKSIQIGAPVEDVFRAWLDMERLPQLTDVIEQVRRDGDRSHWTINVEGRQVEWDAVIEQFILNQAIGWKSVSGSRNSGRITFSPLGTDTMVHVTMNYAPPIRLLTPFVTSFSARLEELIEKVLRDVKSALEARAEAPRPRPTEATGTYGAAPLGGTQHTRFGGTPNSAEFTPPPEEKS